MDNNNGKKSPIIASLLSADSSSSSNDRVVDEEVSKLIEKSNMPSNFGQPQQQPSGGTSGFFATPMSTALPTTTPPSHHFPIPIPRNANSSTVSTKSPGYLNRSTFGSAPSFDFVSLDRSGLGQGPGEVPLSPVGGPGRSHLVFNDNSIHLSPLHRRFTTPSPSGSSVASTGVGGGSGSTKRYSRRRHAKKFSTFDSNHCQFPHHFCPEPVATPTPYCIKHQGLVSPHSKNPAYELCSFKDSKTGRSCRNYRSSRDQRLLFCQSHAERLAKLRDELKRTHLPPQHLHQMVDELRENIDLCNDGRILSELSRGTNFLPTWKETEDWHISKEGVIASDGEEDISLNEIGKFQTEPNDSDIDQGYSEGYDMLRNAGHYTTEELLQMHRSKVEQLESALAKQVELEKLLFKEKRRQFLLKMHELKDPEAPHRLTCNPRRLGQRLEGVGSTFFSGQMDQLRKKKVLLHYCKKSGHEKAVYMKAKAAYLAKVKEKEERKRLDLEFNPKPIEKEGSSSESDEDPSTLMELTRRMKSPVFDLPGTSTSSSTYKSGANSCVFNLGSHKKCGQTVIPTTKFCQQHIFQDPNQRIFESCHKVVNEDGDKCGTPILVGLDEGFCALHRVPRVTMGGLESAREVKDRLAAEATLPEATDEEEEELILNLLAEEATDLAAFEALIEKTLSKGLDKDDTSQSELEEDDEEVEGEMVENPTTLAITEA